MAKQTRFQNLLNKNVKEAGEKFITGGYAFLAATAMLPILEIHLTNPSDAFSTIASMLGGIGGNLIANIVQGAYDKAKDNNSKYDIDKLAEIIKNQMTSNADLSLAISDLIVKSGTLDKATLLLQELPEKWDDFSKKLINEIKTYSGTKIIIDHLTVKSIRINQLTDTFISSSLIDEYLRITFNQTNYLRLGAIDPKFEVDNPIKLSEIYVLPSVKPIKLKSKTPKEIKNPLTIVSRLFRTSIREDLPEGIIILGGPGTGKTSFTDRITNQLSAMLLKSRNPELAKYFSGLKELDFSDWKGPAFLPVKISLQEFAATSIPENATKGKAGFVWDFIEKMLSSNAIRDLSGLFNLILSGKANLDGINEEGEGLGGIVFFDGLDEVPSKKRKIVDESIIDFSRRFNRSAIVVTCRTYSWEQSVSGIKTCQQENLIHSKFDIYNIEPFDQDKIDEFINKWYIAVKKIKGYPEDLTKHRINELIKSSKLPAIRPLAEKPLLLTLMATLHSSRVDLPSDRAKLYEVCVDLLLDIWQKSKDLHIDGNTSVEGGLLDEFGVTSLDVERVLRATAYELSIDNYSKGISPGISHNTLCREFRHLVNESLDEAEKLVHYIQRRAGLLEYVGDESYQFPHKTFVEYLAACYLIDEPTAPKKLIDLFLKDPGWWGEVFSLAISRLSLISYSQSINILEKVIKRALKNSECKFLILSIIIQILTDINFVEWYSEWDYYKVFLRDLIENYLIESRFSLKTSLTNGDRSIFASYEKVLIPYVLPLLHSEAGDAAAIILSKYGNGDLFKKMDIDEISRSPNQLPRLCHIIGGIGGENQKNFLYRIIESKCSKDAKIQAYWALGRLSFPGAEKKLVYSLLSEDYQIKCELAKIISNNGNFGTINLIKDIIPDSDLVTNKVIIDILVSIGSIEAAECLIDMLKSSEYEELMSHIEQAIIQIGGDQVIKYAIEAFYETNYPESKESLRLVIKALRGERYIMKDFDEDEEDFDAINDFDDYLDDFDLDFNDLRQLKEDEEEFIDDSEIDKDEYDFICDPSYYDEDQEDDEGDEISTDHDS